LLVVWMEFLISSRFHPPSACQPSFILAGIELKTWVHWVIYLMLVSEPSWNVGSQRLVSALELRVILCLCALSTVHTWLKMLPSGICPPCIYFFCLPRVLSLGLSLPDELHNFWVYSVQMVAAVWLNYQ
jgi:hypothetical protein